MRDPKREKGRSVLWLASLKAIKEGRREGNII